MYYLSFLEEKECDSHMEYYLFLSDELLEEFKRLSRYISILKDIVPRFYRVDKTNMVEMDESLYCLVVLSIRAHSPKSKLIERMRELASLQDNTFPDKIARTRETHLYRT